ncbi:MAG: type B DNA-directed DNA polymerase [Thermoplasmata archaeon]
MWILDAGYRDGIELWVKDEEAVKRVKEEFPRSFLAHLPDNHTHHELIDSLRSRYGAEACTIRTIYGPLEGYRVYAGREVAEAIERQTRFSARLFNVDVRTEQRFMAERGLFPCGGQKESRFELDFEIPLRSVELGVHGDPRFCREIGSVTISDGRKRTISGSERSVLAGLMEEIESIDPDVILLPEGDSWAHIIVEKARSYGIFPTLSRTGRFSRLEEKSYWSYGRMMHRTSALVPEGRILIDTSESFSYIEGGLRGVLLASRLTGLSPNLTSRFTPGTLISSYEAYEAIRRGLAVPFRKSDPERTRGFDELRRADRGGMMFQPRPGVYERVHQLDFTSLYPSIIVRHNLSPETIESPGRKGFLAEALAPLLELRIRAKSLKKKDERYAKLDSILKWMLVTCFGYTGYRNAKFGSIEVHESITRIARETLIDTKQIAEDMGFEVLHGIVDCLWVSDGPIADLKNEVERRTNLLTEVESYDWIVFLPMSDGGGAYNRYYGRLSDGSMKTRGIALNRKDAPAYIQAMQRDALEIMRSARTVGELALLSERVRAVHANYRESLRRANAKDLVLTCRLGNERYDRRCPQAAALEAYRARGLDVSPGMSVRYVVRDSEKWIVDAEFDAREFDARYYLELLEKAWQEIEYALTASGKRSQKSAEAEITRLSL